MFWPGHGAYGFSRDDDDKSDETDDEKQNARKEFLENNKELLDNDFKKFHPDWQGIISRARANTGDDEAWKIVDDITDRYEGFHETAEECAETQPLGDLGVTFEDIAGADQAKLELYNGFIYPQWYPRLFRKRSAGVLIYGPPGTGKTMLAKAAVGELGNVAFYAPRPSDLKSDKYGEMEKNVSKWFKCAANPPASASSSVIFFDEIEAIAADRTGSGGGEATISMVTALLQEMDGITSSKSVSVIAATNFPRKIDSAVMRRFSSQVFVDLPSMEARLYLIVTALANAYGHVKRGKSRKVRVKITKNGDEWDWICPDDGGWLCNFLDNIKKWGFISPKEVNNCRPGDLNRCIRKGDIIDLANKTGPRGTTTYGFSASDIDKLMATIITNAANRALRMKGVVAVDVDWNPTKCCEDAHKLIVVEQAENFDRDQIRKMRNIEPKDKAILETFAVTRFDICYGLATFRPTIVDSNYEDLVAYRDGRR